MALGRHAGAIELARQSVEICVDMGLTLRLADGRYTLGVALVAAGRIAEGLGQLTDALGTFHESRQSLWEGVRTFG